LIENMKRKRKVLGMIEALRPEAEGRKKNLGNL
jgi:hypothetical protein